MKKTTYNSPNAKIARTNSYSQLITIVALVLFFCFNASAQSNRMSVQPIAEPESVTTELSGGNNPAINMNNFSAYAKYKQVSVRSLQVIASMTVSNTTGRTVFTANNINTVEYKTEVLDLPNQVLIVRVVFANGASAVKKVHLN